MLCHLITVLFIPDPAMLQVPPHYSSVHTWPCDVTEPTVHTRVPCCRCHSLTYLNVNYCEHISEAGIELLGLTHSLVSLDISGCNCGDQGLSALGNNTRLRDVCLSECMNITDLGLQKFAQQCHEIQRLDLSHCMVGGSSLISHLNAVFAVVFPAAIHTVVWGVTFQPAVAAWKISYYLCVNSEE